MRIAVIIIALCLTMLLGLQSCTILLGGSLLQDQTTASAGVIGLLLAFIFVVGAALVWSFPRVSGTLFLVGGAIAILASVGSRFADLAVWGGGSIVLSIMAFLGSRELRPTNQQPLVYVSVQDRPSMISMRETPLLDQRGMIIDQPHLPLLHQPLPPARSKLVPVLALMIVVGVIVGVFASGLMRLDQFVPAAGTSPRSQKVDSGTADVEADETNYEPAPANSQTTGEDASQAPQTANAVEATEASSSSLADFAAASGNGTTDASYSTTVPPAFRGRWDENVSDNCAEREARFGITANKMYDFEVESDVNQVKMSAPNEAEISVTGTDDDGKQYNDVIKLRIVDGGRALMVAGSDTLYRKCPG